MGSSNEMDKQNVISIQWSIISATYITSPYNEILSSTTWYS